MKSRAKQTIRVKKEEKKGGRRITWKAGKDRGGADEHAGTEQAEGGEVAAEGKRKRMKSSENNVEGRKR